MKALDQIKTPPHAETVAEELRERAKRGDLTFSKAEVNRIAAVLDKLSYRCAEAYQVVGSLADAAGCHEDRAVVKAMDLLFQPLRRGDMLPFVSPAGRAKYGKKAEAIFNRANKGPAKPVRRKVRKQRRS